MLAAGELHRVAIPSVEEEALRDLVRAREDLRGDLMRARHRLAKLLLRHEIRFEGTQADRRFDGLAFGRACCAFMRSSRPAYVVRQRLVELDGPGQ